MPFLGKNLEIGKSFGILGENLEKAITTYFYCQTKRSGQVPRRKIDL